MNIGTTICAASNRLGGLAIGEVRCVNIAAGRISVQVEEDCFDLVQVIAGAIVERSGWDERTLVYTDPDSEHAGSIHMKRTLDGVEWDVWCPVTELPIAVAS